MKHLRTTAATLAAVCLATGCGIAAEHKKYDYKTPSGTTTIKPLEVPPELSPLPQGGLITPADAGADNKTAAAEVMPSNPNAELQRDGNQRWLLVKQPPEVAWPTIVQFWKDQGFQLTLEDARAGILETEWAEDRSQMADDAVRRVLSKTFDRMFSSGQKDRYRTRLERRPDGKTEVFVSHQRKVEEFADENKTDVRWFRRPADPEAEAFMLSQLLQKFGVPAAEAKQQTEKNAETGKNKPGMASGDAAPPLSASSIEIMDSFDRTWRRVGLGLDRNGFTVTDRDRSHGLYFIRYADPDTIRSNGIFGALFGDKDTRAEEYQLEIVESTGKCTIRILDKDGKPSNSDTAKRILGLLKEQLK